MTERILLAFDFDWTIIDNNSDLYIKKLASDVGNQSFDTFSGIPQEIEDSYSDTGWTEYMAAIFSYLHQNGINKELLCSCVEEIPLTKGMQDLIRFATENGHECIIISDSNSIFIQRILEKVGLSNHIAAVYTNPAAFDSEGKLTIEYYHTQDWCDLSTVNLCKGHILEEHVKSREKEGICYSKIIYVGDGTNDICPSLRLQKHDYVCARVNYSLWKKIKVIREGLYKGKSLEIKAKVIDWETGFDVLEVLKKIEENKTSK